VHYGKDANGKSRVDVYYICMTCSFVRKYHEMQHIKAEHTGDTQASICRECYAKESSAGRDSGNTHNTA